MQTSNHHWNDPYGPGRGLLLSMLVPRCFVTVLLAAGLILLGWLIRR